MAILTALDAYKTKRQGSETIVAFVRRLHKEGTKITSSTTGTQMSQLDMLALRDCSNVLVHVGEKASNSISARSIRNVFNMVHTSKLTMVDCRICGSQKSSYLVNINDVPGSLCTVCRASDFNTDVKDILKDKNLLEKFDETYQLVTIKD